MVKSTVNIVDKRSSELFLGVIFRELITDKKRSEQTEGTDCEKVKKSAFMVYILQKDYSVEYYCSKV